MNNNYQIKNKSIDVFVNTEIYPLPVIKKAAASFLNNNYIIIENNNNNHIVNIKPQDKSANLDLLASEFYNELLREAIRYDISKETKNIRELLYARALYTTCIDNEEKTEDLNIEKIEKSNYELDDIAINWFDKYKEED